MATATARLVRPIFVLGLNKSGTSLLNLCLTQHPEVSGIRSFVDREKKWKGGTAHLRLDRFQLGEGHKIPGLPNKLAPKPGSSGRFAHPDVCHLYRLTEADVEPGDVDRVTAAYRRGMIDEAQRLCEKSPPNLIRSRYLQAIFPDATFVIIVRDPYANISANAKVRSKWGTIRDQALHWAEAHRLLLEDLPVLKQAIVIKYEDFVNDVSGSLSRITELCGLARWMPSALPVEVYPAINDELVAKLDASDRAIIRKACGDLMAQFDYDSERSLDALPSRDRPAGAS